MRAASNFYFCKNSFKLSHLLGWNEFNLKDDSVFNTFRLCFYFLILSLFSSCTAINQLFNTDEYQHFYKLRETGYQYYKNQGYEAALKYYQIALTKKPAQDDQSVRADLFFKIGRAYFKLQRYLPAIDAFKQALELQQHGDDSDRAIVHNILGLSYLKVGQIDQAQAQLGYAIKLRNSNQDAPGVANALANLATTFLAQGRYLQAIAYYQRAHSIFVQQPQIKLDNLAKILMDMGNVYAEMGQYERALSYQQQAKTVFKKTKNKKGVATSYHNIGYIKSVKKEYGLAIDAFKQAILLREANSNHFGVAETENNLGMALIESGQYQQAIEVLNKALSGLEQLNTHKQIAATYDSLGYVYQRLGIYKVALEYFQKSLLIWREMGDRDNMRITLGNIADTLSLAGRKTLAIVFYKQAVNITESIRKQFRVLPDQAQHAYLARVENFYRHLSDLLLQQNRIIEAQQVLDLQKIQEASGFLGPLRGNETTAKGVVVLTSEQTIEQHYKALLGKSISISKALNELSKIARNDRTETQNKQYADLFKQQLELKNAFQRFIDSDEIIDLTDQLSRSVQRQMPALDKLASLTDNLNRLGPHVVLLYPLLLKDRLEIVLVSGQGPPIHVAVALKRSELNQTVLNFRAALINRQSNVYEYAEILYHWLIAPIEHQLQEIAAKTILYAPDGALRYVPLAALYDGRQWMVERFEINNITAYSTTDLETQPIKKPKVLAAAFASGKYSFKIADRQFNFSGLSYAAKEVQSLAALYPDMVMLLDQRFQPATVIPDLLSFNIVHFATHAALLSGQAYASFILFGNGERVTIDRIKQEWMLPNVDLIVLSACETALGAVVGNGEEILGFGYLMEKAGARATLASLWPVDDKSTQILMTEFYKNMKQSGISKAQALQKAQQALLAQTNLQTEEQGRGVQLSENIGTNLIQRAYRHPFYWAPFILIGNGL